jgi:hypothetical protein
MTDKETTQIVYDIPLKGTYTEGERDYTWERLGGFYYFILNSGSDLCIDCRFGDDNLPIFEDVSCVSVGLRGSESYLSEEYFDYLEPLIEHFKTFPIIR